MADKPKNNKSTIEELQAEILARLADEAPIPEGFDEITYRNPLDVEGRILQGRYLEKIQKNIGGKPVNCYLVENEGGTHTVIGAAQIDTFFEAAKPGQEVWIQRGPEIKAGKHGRVTLYRTALRK